MFIIIKFLGTYHLIDFHMYTVSLMRLLLILCVHPQYGDSPLGTAALNGKLPIIELLVQHGVNVRQCDDVSNVNCIHVYLCYMSPYMSLCHCCFLSMYCYTCTSCNYACVHVG